MDQSRKIRNVVLIGFMATGKSCVGQLVAAQLGFRFIDTDALIEAQAGYSIAAIFAQEGEARFREYERQVVGQLDNYRQAVIATGGGLGANPDHLARLRCHGLLVCLWASPEVIWHRASRHRHRPLIRGSDARQTIRDLLAKRLPFYRQADVLINTELRPVKRIAQQIIHQYRLAACEGSGK